MAPDAITLFGPSTKEFGVYAVVDDREFARGKSCGRRVIVTQVAGNRHHPIGELKCQPADPTTAPGFRTGVELHSMFAVDRSAASGIPAGKNPFDGAPVTGVHNIGFGGCDLAGQNSGLKAHARSSFTQTNHLRAVG